MMKMIYAILAVAMMAACTANNQATTGDTDAQQSQAAEQTVNFSGDSAYAFVKAQCDMGSRVPGTPAHEQCARWMTQMLQQWCDTVVVQRAGVTTFDGKNLDIQNVIGSFNPTSDDRILLLAHWDCRPWADNDSDPALRKQPVMGANDAASGVGVMLELARLMSQTRPDVGIDLLMVDAEDWGQSDDEDSWALGTQYWAANPHVPGYKANFGILLDMVGARGAQFSHEYFSRQYAQGVVKMVWDAAQKAGFAGLFVNRQGGAITDDHVTVNRVAGIPCIDIIDMRPDSDTGFYDGWHTTHDTLDQIDPATLKAVGQTLTNLIYGLH